MDLGFVVAGSNSYTAYIYSDVNGTLKSLFNQTYSGSVAANSTLIFDAEGSSLILSLNGNIIGHATDTVLASTAGSVGMWTSSGAVMSNFVAAPVTLQTASNANVAVSVMINTLTTGQGVGSVRRLRGKHGHAHRAELVRQSGHGQLRHATKENVSVTITLSNGQSAGQQTITVFYSGDGNFLKSTSGPLTQTVNQAATTSRVTS